MSSGIKPCTHILMYDEVKSHSLGTLSSYRYRLFLLRAELILLDIGCEGGF